MSTPNFKEFLKVQAAVLAVAGERLYENKIPQHVQGDARKMPCVVWRRDGSARDRTFCATDSLVEGSWSFEAKAPDYVVAKNLADAVRDSMVDYSGLMGNVHVDKVFIEDEADFIDDEPGLLSVTQSFTVWFLEA